MKQTLSLKDKLAMFQQEHAARDKEMGGQHLGSPAHLRALRRFYNKAIPEYGKSQSLQDVMMVESMKDARKGINKKLDKGWLKRNTKQFFRWAASKIEKSTKQAVSAGVNKIRGRKASGPMDPRYYPGNEASLAASGRKGDDTFPGDQKVHQNRRAGMVVDRGKHKQQGAATKQPQPQERIPRKRVPKKGTTSETPQPGLENKAEKLDRSLARSGNRTVRQDNPGMRKGIS